jgi:predicted flavoprotein YhiN
VLGVTTPIGLVYRSGMPKAHSFGRDDRKKFVQLLKNLTVEIAGLLGFDKAVVADGGVPLTEINTGTFTSKVIPNLYITGDLLHIKRPSGGYSLQLCWTSGYVAGSSV